LYKLIPNTTTDRDREVQNSEIYKTESTNRLVRLKRKTTNTSSENQLKILRPKNKVLFRPKIKENLVLKTSCSSKENVDFQIKDDSISQKINRRILSALSGENQKITVKDAYLNSDLNLSALG
jgi:hypothetical protein